MKIFCETFTQEKNTVIFKSVGTVNCNRANQHNAVLSKTCVTFLLFGCTCRVMHYSILDVNFALHCIQRQIGFFREF